MPPFLPPRQVCTSCMIPCSLACVNVVFIVQLLVMYGGNVNCKANSGYTPLHLAASSGRTKCVQRLLQAKADFFTPDGYGKTALQTAELGGKTDVIRILKSAGESWIYYHLLLLEWCKKCISAVAIL